MTALENLHRLHADATACGLQVRLCKDGVLVLATPQDAEEKETHPETDLSRDGGAGGEGRPVGHGESKGPQLGADERGSKEKVEP